jgi:SSS family solute:Na+ symporter
MTTHLRIPVLDVCIIVLYILAILSIGIFPSRKTKVTGQVFFLAGRSLPWGVVGAALFASNISTIHLIGLSASGYNEGLVWGNFEWMAVFTLILLSLVFAPFYFRSKISTLPEFLERRYSPASRSLLAFMAILAALFIHIGMSLYAGAVVFHQFLGLNVFASVLIVAAAVSIYTVFGRPESGGDDGNRQYRSASDQSLTHYRVRSPRPAGPWHSHHKSISGSREAEPAGYVADA